MGTFVDSLFTVLMSWVRALVNGLWALFSRENTMLEFLGKNWLLIAAALIAAGLVIDWLVWLVRWQPYHIWAQRVRRLLRLPQEDEAEDGGEEPGKARPAVLPEKKWRSEWDDEAAWEAQAAYAAYEAAGAPAVDEEEEREVMARADGVPDEVLGAYPGMRYDSAQGAAGGIHETQRYSALTSEGPGAAEVSRRRGEIDAYRRMQEEAAERARAEREARMQAQRAAKQEEERLAEERLAQERLQRERQEEERRAEEARLAQEAYQRELEEYERKMAQYERDLAEYERQKAEYEAQQREYEAQQSAADDRKGARRRRTDATYSEYVQGDAVAELPDAPAWPQMDEAAAAAQEQPAPKAGRKARQKDGGKSRLMSRMAKIIEGEEEAELASLHALPPRVDRRDAYRPAKEAKPERKTAKRSNREV